MSTAYPAIWNALAAEFPECCIRERPAGGGRKVVYITARTAMNRLDDVLGWENWEDAYERDPNGSDNILCRLTITLPDGRKLTKCDVGAPGNTGDDGEDDKGAVSDAFKRACVKFGVGRYLYGEGVYRCPSAEPSAVPHEPLPAPAPPPLELLRPAATAPAPAPAPPRPASAPGPETSWGNPPRSGKQLWAWLAKREETHKGIQKYMTRWGEVNEFPRRIVDYDESQVADAHAEAVRKLEEVSRKQAIAS